MPLPKPCRRCRKRFQPFGRTQRLCDVCWKKAQTKRMRKLNENKH